MDSRDHFTICNELCPSDTGFQIGRRGRRDGKPGFCAVVAFEHIYVCTPTIRRRFSRQEHLPERDSKTNEPQLVEPYILLSFSPSGIALGGQRVPRQVHGPHFAHKHKPPITST